MDWIAFVSIVAVPAFFAAIGLAIWCYRDNRSSIRFNENRFIDTFKEHEKEMALIRASVAAVQYELTLAIIEKYATKDELREMKGEILEAVKQLRNSLDRNERTKS